MGRGSERSKTLRRRVKPQANARVVSTGAKWIGPGAILSEVSAVTCLGSVGPGRILIALRSVSVLG